MKLTGKKALITGGNSSIGLATRIDSVKRLEHAMNTFEQPMTTHRIGTGGLGC